MVPPQCVFHKGVKGRCVIEDGDMVWEFPPSQRFPKGQRIDMAINPMTRLPELRVFHDANQAAEQVHTALHSCVTEEVNQNLTVHQKNLLQLHFRLGHLAMQSIKWLARNGILGRVTNGLLNAGEPMCATCQYAKQTRTPTGTTQTRVRPGQEGGLKQDCLEPGDGTARIARRILLVLIVMEPQDTAISLDQSCCAKPSSLTAFSRPSR